MTGKSNVLIFLILIGILLFISYLVTLLLNQPLQRNIPITGIDIVEENDEFILIEVATKHDLSELDDSLWAVEIVLAYNVIRDDSGADLMEAIEDLKFRAERMDSTPFPEDTYCSTWKILKRDECTWRTPHPSYTLDSDCTLYLKLWGGRLKGGRIRSNTMSFKYRPGIR